MTENPFEDNNIPMKFITEGQQEALARLQLSVRQKALGVLTGEIGSGKSTLLRHLVGTLSSDLYQPVYLCMSRMKPRDFYSEVLYQLGESAPFLLSKSKRLFNETIRTRHHQKEKTLLLIVDEAHDILPEMLLEFRIIMNHDMDSESLFPIILAGQPEFRRTLKLKKYEAVSQRIKMQYHLSGMSKNETTAYIKSRMEKIERPVFAESAISKLHAYTQGIPRPVNLICANALFDAKSNKEDVIEEKHIIRVISDLEMQRGSQF